jgi:osmotically-inducible protein OsmY
MIRNRKNNIFVSLALVYALCVISSCVTPTINDGKLQGEIATKLYEHPDLTMVSVVVTDGIAVLSGEVADESLKIKAGSLATITGIREVQNNVSVIVQNRSELDTSTNSDINIESEPSSQIDDIENLSWDEKAHNFICTSHDVI